MKTLEEIKQRKMVAQVKAIILMVLGIIASLAIYGYIFTH